jgi:transposase-like protein
MRFRPPRCPYEGCPQHADPRARFWIRHGYYQPRCRRRPIPRFRCRACRRTFSRQTFRHDYRDKRPHCNATLFWSLASSSGLRQAGRELELGVGSVQRKFRKIARTCRGLHRNLCPALPPGRTFLLDEEETYEKASIRPLTMPVVIEKETYFVVATMAGPIRRLAAPGTARRRRQERDEARRGPRRDRSRACVRATLRALGGRLRGGELTLLSDEKASYRTLGAEVFGEAVHHVTTSSRMVRSEFNPLFPINLTLAMTRDNCGRLHRSSWLVTEKRRCLQLHMHVFTAYRNYVRRRHNDDGRDDTPAALLGLLPRPLKVREVLAWRQDWGARSIHPTSCVGARAVA